MFGGQRAIVDNSMGQKNQKKTAQVPHLNTLIGFEGSGGRGEHTGCFVRSLHLWSLVFFLLKKTKQCVSLKESALNMCATVLEQTDKNR